MDGYDFSNVDSTNDRDFHIDERIFPSGRRIQAIHREAVEHEDENGRINFRVRRLAAADCGCACLLVDMFQCARCGRVVCHRHTCAVPCSICNQPTFCHQCFVRIDIGDGTNLIPACLNCAAGIKPPTILRQLWTGIVGLIVGKKKEESSVPARRDQRDSS
jgi:hypothetical protein